MQQRHSLGDVSETARVLERIKSEMEEAPPCPSLPCGSKTSVMRLSALLFRTMLLQVTYLT